MIEVMSGRGGGVSYLMQKITGGNSCISITECLKYVINNSDRAEDLMLTCATKIVPAEKFVKELNL